MNASIIVAAITALGSVIVAALGWATKKGVNYIDTKTKVLDEAHNARKKETIKESVVNIVTLAAKETMQTYVKAIREGRKDGKLTKEEKKQAFQLTRDKAVNILRDEGLEVSKELLGTVIEAVVGDIKPVKDKT